MIPRKASGISVGVMVAVRKSSPMFADFRFLAPDFAPQKGRTATMAGAENSKEQPAGRSIFLDVCDRLLTSSFTKYALL